MPDTYTVEVQTIGVDEAIAKAERLRDLLAEIEAKSASPHPVHIDKVEINVTGQDPSRIARMVLAEVQNIQRHPKLR